MIDFPLIRFDNREWLEKLQQGDFYMKNCLYYQQLESNDIARYDPYDGSLPFPDEKGIMKAISGKETKNHRIMFLDLFVKCFYSCDSTDFLQIGDSLYKVAFPAEAKDAIRDFKVDSAMILFSPAVFIKQIETVCNARQESIVSGMVEYLNESDYQKKQKSLFNYPNERAKIPFYKAKRFSNQKEYRVCVQHSFLNMEREKQYLELPKSIASIPYSIDIGQIKDTCIVSVENLLSNRIILNYRNQQYNLCEE